MDSHPNIQSSDQLKNGAFSSTDRTLLRGCTQFDVATDWTEVEISDIKVNTLFYGLKSFGVDVGMNGLGIHTGIDLDALVDTAGWISERLGRAPASKVARAVLARRTKAG